MNSNSKILLIISIVIIFHSGCTENNIDISEHNDISISVEDTTATSISFRIKSTSLNNENTVFIKRDSIHTVSIRLGSTDTIVTDINLLPKHNYYYQFIGEKSQDYYSVLVETKDTTSHQWNWSIEYIGDGNNSYFNDIAIINDTLAYAVGVIYKKNSFGVFDTQLYNYAIWNGREWKINKLVSDTRILYPGSGGDSELVVKGSSIFAFGPNDIWIAAGNVFHFNGIEWSQQRGELAGFCNKIFGSSSSDIYFVGDDGKIVYFNGLSWRNVVSNTKLNIYDIYGCENNRTNKYDIYAVASNLFVSYDKRVLKFESGLIDSIPSTNIPYSIHGIWLSNSQKCFIAGAHIYNKDKKQLASFSPWIQNAVSSNYLFDITGNTENDIMSVGGNGEVIHFNGYDWKSFKNVTMINGNYSQVSIKGNVCGVVGSTGSNAVITMGLR